MCTVQVPHAGEARVLQGYQVLHLCHVHSCLHNHQEGASALQGALRISKGRLRTGQLLSLNLPPIFLYLCYLSLKYFMSCNKNGAQNLESFSKSAVWEKFKLARNVSPDQQVSFSHSNA